VVAQTDNEDDVPGAVGVAVTALTDISISSRQMAGYLATYVTEYSAKVSEWDSLVAPTSERGESKAATNKRRNHDYPLH
jgi:hypothetical protein